MPEPGPLEGALDVLDEVLVPGVFLLRTVHGDERLLRQLVHLVAEPVQGLEHLGNAQPRLQLGDRTSVRHHSVSVSAM